MAAIDLKSLIRDIPDWPEPGVGFKDILPLLRDPDALGQAIDDLAVVDARAGARPGARRGGPRLLARRRDRERSGLRLHPGAPARQAPAGDGERDYALEYGQNSLELHADAIGDGTRVVIHDDVLATGGTVEAIAGLVEQMGGEVVGVCFIIDLTFLGGRERLSRYPFYSLIEY